MNNNVYYYKFIFYFLFRVEKQTIACNAVIISFFSITTTDVKLKITNFMMEKVASSS